ncbi:anhydro-N-acetylmuramic acid kinase [Aliamphritea hakodatensis]|uniref:anhydro-N-acetylmuramic acid kinase n=1 Tax=Aliamphritea hakodatensis TaxID=2895352 RepID=UPI0022FD69AE|nr:anhydro-N-acetylmuramic acid kinase [Aliamphritea hakodatensis]
MPASVYIGLMSGTSLDGIDAVAVSFEPHFRLLGTHSETLPESLNQNIRSLLAPGDNEIDRLGMLDLDLGKAFAGASNNLLAKHKLAHADIRAIGSHGQTIRHRPEHHFTLQSGDPNTIAEHTGIMTIADFRRRDMAAGGQGAPLVPAFHNALFHSPETNRVIVNIGGMANLTVLPACPDAEVLGYDTGPGNVLMDSWIHEHQQLSYDRNGNWAAQGNVIPQLLEQMLSLPFFHEPAPKSTGREQFNLIWIQRMLTLLDQAPNNTDVQATLAELTATSIAMAIRSHGLETAEVYLCGGGSHNRHLQQRIQALLPGYTVATTAALNLHPDWVEAVAFAWLAKQTLENLPGNMPTVTGASGYRILGAIYPA